LDRQAATGTTNRDVNYDYDLDGKVTRLTVTGNGYDYTFTYDARGRFQNIVPTGATAPFFQYSYDDASNETQRYSSANGITQKYTRDALDRMTRRDVTKGATSLSYEIYNHNPMGQVTFIDREGTNDDRFAYYLDGELNWASYGTGH
jgi:YD repeat-containing protein